MIHLLIIFLIISLYPHDSFVISPRLSVFSIMKRTFRYGSNGTEGSPKTQHKYPFDDVEKLGFILSNITQNAESNPEKVFSVLSTELSWLFKQNIPRFVLRFIFTSIILFKSD